MITCRAAAVLLPTYELPPEWAPTGKPELNGSLLTSYVYDNVGNNTIQITSSHNPANAVGLVQELFGGAAFGIWEASPVPVITDILHKSQADGVSDSTQGSLTIPYFQTRYVSHFFTLGGGLSAPGEIQFYTVTYGSVYGSGQ